MVFDSGKSMSRLCYRVFCITPFMDADKVKPTEITRGYLYERQTYQVADWESAPKTALKDILYKAPALILD